MSEYAKCNFDKIMIDDDFNSVNHDTGPTGCFCSLHAKKVSEAMGIEIDTEKLFYHVTHNDDLSMKVREAWLNQTYKGQLEAISAMEKGIHEINPNTLFGMMNSSSSAHAMQGRNMRELLEAAAGENNPPLSRPGGWAYSDTFHDGIVGMHRNTAQCIAAQGDGVIYLSEVENFPRNIFSKSKKLLDLHMSIHSLTGVSELTLNIFDHFQTPIRYSMEYLDVLKDNKAKYDELESLRKGKELQGIGFPWKEDISYKLINRKNSPSEVGYRHQLDVPFQRMGFPVQYTEGSINCLEGDLVNCYSDEELEGMLAKGLILDRLAARNLCERGFGELIGVDFVEELKTPCFEIFDNEDYNKNYINQYTAILNGSDGSISAYKFSPLKDAIAASQIMDKEKSIVSPGTILFTNKLGGKICVFALPYDEGVNWNNKPRQEQLQNIIKWITDNQYSVIVEDSVNVMPLHYGGANGDLLAIVNTGFDEQN
ncbi:MAG: hypothetical protein GX815_12515, partial [Clostridiales bacterium]|nr:hypothetical protein [Clostridiales bacterium]